MPAMGSTRDRWDGGRSWRRRSAVAGAIFAAGLLASMAAAEQPSVTWYPAIQVASGDAVKGPWRQNDSVFLYVDDPSVAIGDDGAIGVVWANQSRLDVLFQVYEPGGATRFDVPVNVSRSPAVFSWLPRLVLAPGDPGEVYVLWQEIVFSGGSHGGETFFARSTDGGRTFEVPINLSNSLAGDGKGRLSERRWHNGSLDIVRGPDGDLYAAWSEYEGKLWFARSTDQGRTFSSPLMIADIGDGGPARGPSLAVGETGLHLVWAVGEDDAADIRIATSYDGGVTFEAPRIALETASQADAPKIAVDGAGTLHLVFAESPEGRFSASHIAYTRSRDGGSSFDPPRPIEGPDAASFESFGFPSLALGGTGTVYLVWELFPREGRRSEGLGFTLSQDGGETFAPSMIVPGSLDQALGVNGSLQGLLMRKLAADGAGRIAIVNSTFKPDDASHIWLFRGKTDVN